MNPELNIKYLIKQAEGCLEKLKKEQKEKREKNK